METNMPKIGIGVIVRKDGMVLMRKRRNSHGDGTWGFTGGHLEFRETIEECAKRETEEEAGIKIKNVTFGPFTEDIFEKENKHYVTLFVVSDYDSGEVTNPEPEKCEEIKWAPWNDMPKPLMLPIEHLLEQGFDPFK